MADVIPIREALAKALQPLGFQVSPWVLSDPTPPCAYVTVGAEDYHQAMGIPGMTSMNFVIFVLVGLVTDIGAQKQLAPMMALEGSKSVKALLEGDRSLGGLAQSIVVEGRTGERVYRIPNRVLGCEWAVVVRPA